MPLDPAAALGMWELKVPLGAFSSLQTPKFVGIGRITANRANNSGLPMEPSNPRRQAGGPPESWATEARITLPAAHGLFRAIPYYYPRELPQSAQIFSAAKERKDRKEGVGKAQSLCSLCSLVAIRLRLAALRFSVVQRLLCAPNRFLRSAP
jgi:hypothetical protein